MMVFGLILLMSFIVLGASLSSSPSSTMIVRAPTSSFRTLESMNNGLMTTAESQAECQEAEEHGDVEALTELVLDAARQPHVEIQKVFNWAIKTKHLLTATVILEQHLDVDVTQPLFRETRVDSRVPCLQSALGWASFDGELNLVKHLLACMYTANTVWASAEIHRAIVNAGMVGHANVLEVLLDCPGLHLTRNEFRIAYAQAKTGPHDEVVSLMWQYGLKFGLIDQDLD